jgi:hypothetical protein
MNTQQAVKTLRESRKPALDLANAQSLVFKYVTKVAPSF